MTERRPHLKVNENILACYRWTLQQWWTLNARPYLWRELSNRTPYRIAIAELMLRRTRADQVAPVYNRFLTAYPDLRSGATADRDEIRRLLYPLGLAWRIDDILAFLREAHDRFGDDLPDDPDTVRTLPGVGDYVGAAIGCFAGNRPVPLIDVNVVRVLGRLFDLNYAGEARRRRPMRDLAMLAMDTERPADYHYALLDFAAKVCVAGRPRCEICPFRTSELCDYHRTVVTPASGGDGNLNPGLPAASEFVPEQPPRSPGRAKGGRHSQSASGGSSGAPQNGTSPGTTGSAPPPAP